MLGVENFNVKCFAAAANVATFAPVGGQLGVQNFEAADDEAVHIVWGQLGEDPDRLGH